MKSLVIIGAGGHAKVCYDIACLMGLWENILFLDDNPVSDWCLISGKTSEFRDYLEKAEFFVALGDNYLRGQYIAEIIDHQGKLATLIHPSAVLATNTTIDVGTCVMPNAVVNSAAVIGKGVIINSGVIVEHDCLVGDFVHLSPGVALGGMVRVGAYTWIGLKAIVKNALSVVDRCVIGMGSVVLNDIVEQGIYYGVPAFKRK